MPSKKQKKINIASEMTLREACIAKGLELIEKNGLDNLSLREIARELGVSHGAPYRHFHNKDELITEITLEGFRMLSEYLQRAFSAKTPSLQLREMGRSYMFFALEHPDYYRLLFDYRHSVMNKYKQLKPGVPGVSSEDLKNELCDEPAMTAGIEAFQILEKQISAIVPDRSAEEVSKDAIYVWSNVHGIAMLLLNDQLTFRGYGRETIDELADLFYERILRAIGKKK